MKLNTDEKKIITEMLTYNGDYTKYQLWEIIAIIANVVGWLEIEWSKDYNKHVIPDPFVEIAVNISPNNFKECISVYVFRDENLKGNITIPSDFDFSQYFYDYNPGDFTNVSYERVGK